jgi:transcriptional regulator with XRE-family HTH domain
MQRISVTMVSPQNLQNEQERTGTLAGGALRLAGQDSDNRAMEIGNVIRTLRQERGLTLEELALRIGSDAGNLSRVERGKQRYTPEMLQAIADALKTPISNLFFRAEQTLAAYGSQSKKEYLRGGPDSQLFISLRGVVSHLDADNQKLVLEFAKMLSRQTKPEKGGSEE